MKILQLDPGSWSGWEEIVARWSIPEDGKAVGIAALRRLRHYFGEEWPRGAQKEVHPLYLHLATNSVWACDRFAELMGKLAALEAVPGFDFLVARLKQKRQYSSAALELTIAYRAHAAGLPIQLSTAVGLGRPDITLCLDPVVYIELSFIRPPDQHQLAEESLLGLGLVSTLRPDVAVGGQIHEILPRRLLSEYQAKLTRIIDEAASSGQPQEFHDPGIVDFYAVPRENGPALERWSQEGKLSSIAGPPLRMDTIERLRGRLRDKARRAPGHGANIIVLLDNLVSHWSPLKLIAYHTAEVIEQFAHISAAAILMRQILPRREKTSVDHHDYGLVFSQPFEDLSMETVLAVPNATATRPTAESLLLALLEEPGVRSH